MALFGFGKKKEKVKADPACDCNGGAVKYVAKEACCQSDKADGIKSIKVLGPGCKSCHELNTASIAAVKELGLKVEVEYITDMEKITSYGVMSMPALVINEKVVFSGKALKHAEIIKLLKKLGYC